MMYIEDHPQPLKVKYTNMIIDNNLKFNIQLLKININNILDKNKIQH